MTPAKLPLHHGSGSNSTLSGGPKLNEPGTTKLDQHQSRPRAKRRSIFNNTGCGAAKPAASANTPYPSPSYLVRCRSSNLSPSSRRTSTIADEILNDAALLLIDDDDDDDCVDGGVEDNHCYVASFSESWRAEQRTQFENPRRASTLSTSTALQSRRSSQQSRLCDLQREVDEALELFSGDFDVDDCLDVGEIVNENANFFEPTTTKLGSRLRLSSQTSTTHEGTNEEYDSFPGTASTSLTTSSDCDEICSSGDTCHGSIAGKDDVDDRGLEAPETPRMSGSGGFVSSEFGLDGSFRGSISCDLSQMGSCAMSGPKGLTGGKLSYKHKTKSILSLPLSLLPSKTTMNNCIQEEDDAIQFENVIMEELQALGFSDAEKNDKSFFVNIEAHSSLRNALEPFLAVARLQREEARQQVFKTLEQMISPDGNSRCGSLDTSNLSIHIGSTYGVPYPALRTETPFLYDNETYPLDKVLAETLDVKDLSQLHLQYPCSEDKARLMSPLQNRSKRRAFHRCFDSFVTSHVIPLLHSKALASDVFYTNRHQLRKGKPQKIIYRYQAFPCIRVVRPGECSVGPHCDMADGHSIGNISFHIPLTSSFGTNALYVESRPGREDWHPLMSKSGPGLGFQFDGARCLHFTLNNDTNVTRVSLDFRIAITRASHVNEVMSSNHPPAFIGDVVDYDPDDQLCCHQLLDDDYSLSGPGYYDEVVVNVGEVPRSFMPGPVAMKRPFSQNKLVDPDERVGFPFSIASNCCR
ncbi:hypothetical protein ACHAXS_013224 [Conticribra weissflogii]